MSSAVMWFVTLCALVNVCLTADLPKAQPTYMTRYDYLDIDKILTNERILRRLMDCIMDRGPCTREGKELKRIIPDALRTNCSKCNDRQKINTGRALAYLLHYKPEYWFQLLNKFDRDGSFRRKLNIEDESAETTVINRKTRSISFIDLLSFKAKLKQYKKLKKLKATAKQLLFLGRR